VARRASAILWVLIAVAAAVQGAPRASADVEVSARAACAFTYPPTDDGYRVREVCFGDGADTYPPPGVVGEYVLITRGACHPSGCVASYQKHQLAPGTIRIAPDLSSASLVADISGCAIDVSIAANGDPPAVQRTLAPPTISPPYVSVTVAAALQRWGTATGSLCGDTIDPALPVSGVMYVDGWVSGFPV